MGLVSSIVRLKDTTPGQNPVPGVTLRFYDATDVFIVEEVTDVNGEVDVLLDGSPDPGTEYHVRAYRPGCSFGGPWKIEVQDPVVDDNDWTMSVNVFEVPNSPYPGMCRVAGYIYDPAGKPIPKAFFRFSLFQCSLDLRVYYAGLIDSAFEVRADDNGYVQVDVFRKCQYDVVAGDWIELKRRVNVPDRGGVLLADLLFPIPMSIAWGVVPPIHVGEQVELQPVVTGSDYNDWGLGGSWVVYSSDDEAIARVTLTDKLVIEGIAVGTTNIRVARAASAFRVFPDRPFSGDVLAVVIQP